MTEGELRGPKHQGAKVRVQCNFTPEDYRRFETICEAMSPKIAVSRFVMEAALRILAALEQRSLKAGQ